MLTFLIFINAICFSIAILLSLRIKYLERQKGNSSKDLSALKSLFTLMWLGFLIVIISSFITLLLSIIIGNWSILIVIYIVLAIFYTIKHHRKYNHDK